MRLEEVSTDLDKLFTRTVMVVNGTALTLVEGTALALVEWIALALVEGTALTLVEGTALALVEGTALTLVEGTALALVEGTALTLVEGTLLADGDRRPSSVSNFEPQVVETGATAKTSKNHPSTEHPDTMHCVSVPDPSADDIGIILDPDVMKEFGCRTVTSVYVVSCRWLVRPIES